MNTATVNHKATVMHKARGIELTLGNFFEGTYSQKPVRYSI
jgi:hypothetical protein